MKIKRDFRERNEKNEAKKMTSPLQVVNNSGQQENGFESVIVDIFFHSHPPNFSLVKCDVRMHFKTSVLQTLL